MANAQFVINADQLSEDMKQEVIKTLRLPEPTTEASSSALKITVRSFAAVLVGTAAVLCAGVFWPENGTNLVTGDMLLSVFTLAAGFFGGLFTPSPNS